MDDDTDAKMILMAPPPQNWKKPPACPCITWLNTVQRDLSAYNLTERSSQPGSEPPSVEADVYIWRYALLVVHARKEKDALQITAFFLSEQRPLKTPSTVTPPCYPWLASTLNKLSLHNIYTLSF